MVAFTLFLSSKLTITPSENIYCCLIPYENVSSMLLEFLPCFREHSMYMLCTKLFLTFFSMKDGKPKRSTRKTVNTLFYLFLIRKVGYKCSSLLDPNTLVYAKYFFLVLQAYQPSFLESPKPELKYTCYP